MIYVHNVNCCIEVHVNVLHIYLAMGWQRSCIIYQKTNYVSISVCICSRCCYNICSDIASYSTTIIQNTLGIKGQPSMITTCRAV